ncbi:MAG TPA: tRNA (guanosine(37)-N1)-methyltransferase TrmD [Coprothermobacter proteolyticus]|nr:tRNA (guanosine(37)-N1)-methyltransferase TrmD [Coprothermobacter proteolyticus]HOA64447.1 tRNA (guanosine(37)-N1)-methyltransferase TrmD [Coprothermobacter proteolyticus]HPU69780.1 tRNA (guanosine(37)-N1)-methyltransferase TrmD [Coprothermobacter proteolyticus]HPZ44468.1 tRNA (guanosine(37)-N1)-methyltransferase TrmD [Coprothermobacter proteolyticus]HQD07424.1 tRNA (guanosine(37)-N1)-methyltransferase TrmD [Coprothermobacter proteolyticus]
MKRFAVVTLFPDAIDCWLQASVVGRARGRAFDVLYVNPRDFAKDRYRSVDDYMFGGGPGMLMRYDVLKPALDHAKTLVQNPLVLALSAGGKVLNQEMCTILSSYEGDIVLLCGHYEGMDDRIFDHVDLEVSVGDYVLSGGELGAAVIMETVIRLLPGFVEKSDNVRKESFTNNLLEEPQFTRPREYEGKEVPEVLLSGHHQRIELWKKEQRIKRTLVQRPDLLTSAKLEPMDLQILRRVLTDMEKVKRAIFGEQSN